jgi:hypothetical protein
MSHKALRILIADEDPGKLLWIERLLNRFDYYRIAPIRTFGDLVQLTSNPGMQFDWLIVNQALASPYGVDLNAFCRARPHIAHALIYETLSGVSDLLIKCPLQLGERPDRAKEANVLKTQEKNTMKMATKLSLTLLDAMSAHTSLASAAPAEHGGYYVSPE